MFSSLVKSLLFFVPSSLHAFKKFLNLNENNFKKYVVCPSCHKLYNFNNCFELHAGRRKPKSCAFIAFPEHPQQVYRLPCATRLLSEVTLKSGKVSYYPRKYYCYKPISDSLTSLVGRNGFLTHCEHWRLRNVPSSTMYDIYDGEI